MIAVVGGDPLAVHRDRLGARRPQLVDDGTDVVRPDEVGRLVGVGRDRRLRILQLDDDPAAGQRDEARTDARLLELAVELAHEVGRPCALGLDVLDL